MPLRVTFELSDKDLAHFRGVMRDARKVAKTMSDDDVLTAAQELFTKVREHSSTEFVNQRLDKLKIMIDMLRDEEWQIPKQEHDRVISALTYFAEEEDLIPDHIPVLGFLDDAIMIELVVRELKHEIDAYEDFCAFRSAERKTARSSPATADEQQRLAIKRKKLHERMRRRGSRDRRARRGGSRPRVSLF
jgi:uncharacterized membrane protein YkvA (DUF1232 family)